MGTFLIIIIIYTTIQRMLYTERLTHTGTYGQGVELFHTGEDFGLLRSFKINLGLFYHQILKVGSSLAYSKV